MKIRIAFLMKPTSGIGGGDRKFMLYYKYLNPDFFDKYFLFLDKTSKILNQKEKIFSIAQEKLEEFLEKNKIDFLYLAAKINEDIYDYLRKRVFFIKNVNFTENYSSEEKVINLIISKTDYYKLKCIHKTLVNSHVVYNPIPVDKWTGLSKNKSFLRQKFNDKKFIIGRLGRSEPTKWNFLIIKTLKLLDKKKNYNYGFIFAGMPKLYRIALRLTLSKKMLQSILFLPELREDKDISDFYNSIDLFWQTSYIGESFGNVIAEAFCFEVPVMTDFKNFFRKDGSIDKKLYNAQSELVDHHLNGAYCNYPSKIMKFIEQANKKKLEKLGKNGLKKVIKNYDARLAGLTMAKILYGYLRKYKKIGKDDRFESLVQIPSKTEVEKYEQEYKRRLSSEINENKIFLRELIAYKFQEKCWNYVEFIYIVIRFLLRKIKIDLEGCNHDKTS